MQVRKWMCTTKECRKRSFATNGRRRGHARTEITASSRMESRNCGRWWGTHATRLKSAAWCWLETAAPTAIAATSGTLSPTRSASWWRYHDHHHCLETCTLLFHSRVIDTTSVFFLYSWCIKVVDPVAALYFCIVWEKFHRLVKKSEMSTCCYSIRLRNCILNKI